MSIYDEMAMAGLGNQPHTTQKCHLASGGKAAHTATEVTRRSMESPATGQGVALASLADGSHRY